MTEKGFLQKVMRISIPVALQAMLQSSFSMVDQIMVGQLGEKSVAAVEILGRQSLAVQGLRTQVLLLRWRER